MWKGRKYRNSKWIKQMIPHVRDGSVLLLRVKFPNHIPKLSFSSFNFEFLHFLPFHAHHTCSGVWRKLRSQVELRMIHNFNAGPSILPKEVFDEAAKAILNFRDTGLSILEIGHRTALFQSVMDEAVLLAKELMKLDSDHEVLFLLGGATTQFFQVPMNLLNENQTAAYLDCGTWGTKAIKEAKVFGNVEVVASSKDKNYTYIPKGIQIPKDAAYFHYTTNNTIEGTEMFSIPETDIPLVADMSSDILSRELDFNRFALIYAGAQKNIGATGVNMVVVRKDILGKVNRKLPGMMDYRQHIENKSMLN